MDQQSSTNNQRARDLIDQLHRGEHTVATVIGALMIWHSEQGSNDITETLELIMAEAISQVRAHLDIVLDR